METVLEPSRLPALPCLLMLTEKMVGPRLHRGRERGGESRRRGRGGKATIEEQPGGRRMGIPYNVKVDKSRGFIFYYICVICYLFVICSTVRTFLVEEAVSPVRL
jgi:hypothetical protein